MAHPIYGPKFCTICKRRLGQADDLLSANCGGDCLACMIECEDGRSAPDPPPEQLALWLNLHVEIEGRLVQAMSDTQNRIHRGDHMLRFV